jgi:hypothetical protein
MSLNLARHGDDRWLAGAPRLRAARRVVCDEVARRSGTECGKCLEATHEGARGRGSKGSYAV